MRWPACGTPSPSSTSASASTPATPTLRARNSSTSSTGSRRSPGGSTWCTSTTRATPSARAPTGTRTSATARSIRSCWWPCAPARVPPWWSRPRRTARPPTSHSCASGSARDAVTGVAADPTPDVDTDARGSADRRPGPARALLALVVLLTGLTLVAGYANKARCVGPEFDAQGRSGPDFTMRANRDVCYSDIQKLWLGRDIDLHVFPYVTGSITPDGELRGGTVEYPVLSGLLMWVAAVPSHTDGEFLVWSALLMAPFGLITGWMLGRLTRWRALLWALGPPLVLYAFHNWDLPVVACAVGAVYAVHGWRTARPLRERALVAGVLLGLGFAFKLYPGAFVAPLALLVL